MFKYLFIFIFMNQCSNIKLDNYNPVTTIVKWTAEKIYENHIKEKK